MGYGWAEELAMEAKKVGRVKVWAFPIAGLFARPERQLFDQSVNIAPHSKGKVDDRSGMGFFYCVWDTAQPHPPFHKKKKWPVRHCLIKLITL